MRSVVLAFAFVAVAFAADSRYDISWNAWKLEHGKSYANHVEETIRRENWEARVEMISRHNAEADLGLHTYRQGLNSFSDLTHSEYLATLMDPRTRNPVESGHEHVASPSTPATMDWRDYGAVTAVKNQEQCGSCWAFSTTGSVEGAWEIAGNTLISLSEQQLVSCDPYDSGCNGGWYYNAFYYLIHNGGSDSEAAYPYTSGNGVVAKCKSQDYTPVATISNYACTKSGSETDLLNAVGNIGPVSVAIDASQASFGNYKSGVYYDPNCSSTMLDHAVLTVGYNSDDGDEYWIVKNSWGTSWGQEGYIWMSRNRDNNCGIATEPCYPIV